MGNNDSQGLDMSEKLLDTLANSVPTSENLTSRLEESTSKSFLSTTESQTEERNDHELNLTDVDKTDLEFNKTNVEIEFENEPAKTEIPEADATQEILSLIHKNHILLERLKEEFETKLKYDNNKETLIDRLYQENRKYKDDFVWSLKKDLICDVIAEIDDVEKRLPYLRQKEATLENYSKLLTYVEEIAENFRLVLERYDVYSYRSEDGAAFEPGRQRTLEVKTTGDKTLDRTTVSVRSGFELDVEGKKRLVRKELVYVYKYDEKLTGISSETSENVQTKTNEAL